MDELRDVVSNLAQMLENGQKEVTNSVDTMHQLQSYLEGESKNIVQGGLDRLLTTISTRAAKLTGGGISSGQAVVLISPDGIVRVEEIYDYEDGDPWFTRLKSQGFQVMTLDVFSSFIRSLKCKMAKGSLIPVIEFLRANAEIEMSLVHPNASPASAVERPRQPSSPSQWKLSDFLPAPFPHPPLPRGLFKH
jgi:hypothetical protein